MKRTRRANEISGEINCKFLTCLSCAKEAVWTNISEWHIQIPRLGASFEIEAQNSLVSQNGFYRTNYCSF